MSMVDDGSTPLSFKKAGFVDVHSRTFKLPATAWPRDPRLQQLGAFSQLAMEQDLDGRSPFRLVFLLTNARVYLLFPGSLDFFYVRSFAD